MVEETLSRLQPTQPDHIIRRLVDASVERAVAPWKRRKEMEKAIERGIDHLPWKAKGIFEPTQWKIRARRAAATALHELKENASFAEMEAAAIEAVEPICQEFTKLEEQESKELELQRRRSSVELGATIDLLHIQTYVTKEYEFDDRREEQETVRDLKEEIRPLLVKELLRHEMDTQKIEKFIEKLVDERI